MKISAALTVTLLVIALSSEYAWSEPAAIRISIEVTETDEDLRNRVSSYLERELLSLGDVAVTDDDPDFKLYAMVMQVRTSDRVRFAYVLSISVVSFFPDEYFDTILRQDLRNADEVKARLGEVTVYTNQFMSIAGPTETNLKQVARNSIEKLNAHILQAERRTQPPKSP